MRVGVGDRPPPRRAVPGPSPVARRRTRRRAGRGALGALRPRDRQSAVLRGPRQGRPAGAVPCGPVGTAERVLDVLPSGARRARRRRPTRLRRATLDEQRRLLRGASSLDPRTGGDRAPRDPRRLGALRRRAAGRDAHRAAQGRETRSSRVPGRSRGGGSHPALLPGSGRARGGARGHAHPRLARLRGTHRPVRVEPAPRRPAALRPARASSGWSGRTT